MKAYIYLVVSILLTAGCGTAEKASLSGDYDQAISICVNKLQRNPEKEAFIKVLESSFRKANERDLQYIHTLNLEGEPGRWEEIYDVYQGISRRQHQITPLLPLTIESENREAQFDFVDVVTELIAAKKNASAYLYASAKAKLESGDRYKSREAYEELQRIKELYSQYKDTEELLDQAYQQGQSLVGFRILQQTNMTLSREVTEAIEQLQPSKTRGFWYEIVPYSGSEDFYLELRITGIEVFPEAVRTNNYVDSKEIEDGWTYVYDTEGQLVKDSLGNAIKTPKYETITAIITENWQEKAALVVGELRYIDQKGNTLKSVPVRGDGVFQHYFATATGYYEAISPASRQRLGGGPVPFPSDNAMLLQAMDVLQQMTAQIMNDLNDEYLNR